MVLSCGEAGGAGRAPGAAAWRHRFGTVSGRHEIVLGCAGIPVCRDRDAVATAMAAGNIAYIPLASLSSQIYRVFGLHRVMGTRSPVNSALTLANPAGARVSLMGVANPSSRELQRDAAMLLSAELTIIGSARCGSIQSVPQHDASSPVRRAQE